MKRKRALTRPLPPAALQRMAFYHCLLNNWLSNERRTLTTSQELADTLGVTDATVRKDLSYLGDGPGVRGTGYSVDSLNQRLTQFLVLPTLAPVAFVGSPQTMDSVLNFFPAEKLGFKISVVFSEDPPDLGVDVNGCGIHPIEAIPTVLSESGIKVAVLAMHPTRAQHCTNLLVKGGIKGILVLSSAINIEVPDGIKLTQVNIQCDLKTLFYHAGQSDKPKRRLH